MFIVVALLILLATSVFTAATWTHFTGLNPAVWQGIAIAVPALFVSVIALSFRRRHFILRVLGTLTAIAVGFLNYAFLAALVSWPILGVLQLAGSTLAPAAVACGIYGAAMLVALYGLIHATRLQITRFTVRLSNLPLAWQGRDVAVVSDLHVGNLHGPAFIRRVIARLNALQPEVVLIAGDMFDGAKVDVARSVAPWKDCRAAGGVYFVTGNHDEFGDRAPYLAALTAVGVRVLNNEKVTVDGLQIVGVHDTETRHAMRYREILQRAGLVPGSPSILVAHQPSHLEIPAKAGISLQVSGHTHGGQFWPWSWVVRRLYGSFAVGLSRFGSLQVVTSSGAGSWGPPLRVGTRSEIVVLRLESQP